MMDAIDLRGMLPESWCCVDCGTNTAPGLHTRAELEQVFAANPNADVEQRITDASEVYTVRDAVWAKAGMKPMGGCLCIGCLERRLSRRLKPKDFPRRDAFNFPQIPGTARLLNRRR